MTNRKDPLLCKLPPQNVEAEEALISAVLIDNSTLSEIVEILSPDDFYKYGHKKIFGSIIDYLQLMKVHRPSERRDLDISEMSRSLKGLAKDLNIPVITLSQLNRQLENRDDKRPRLADLRESGALEQDADVVIFIHREEVFKDKKRKAKETDPVKEGVADIIVAKQRNGPTGTVQLAFVKAYTRFENLAY